MIDKKGLTLEEIEEFFEIMEIRKPDFSEIPESDRLHPNPQICGILKFYELSNTKLAQPVSSEYCLIVWSEGVLDMGPISASDLDYLYHCGVKLFVNSADYPQFYFEE